MNFDHLRNKNAVVVLSGGQDSTTCLYWGLFFGLSVHCITFDYGQRHRREIAAAKRVLHLAAHDCAAKFLPGAVLSHEIMELGGDILKGTSPLVSKEATLGQYSDMNSLPGGLEATFVPMRNQLFATIAANRAYVLDCCSMIMGVCQEDSGGYPDCTQAFIWELENVCNLGTFTGKDGARDKLNIIAPLMNKTKAASVKLAQQLPGCMDALAYSHTGYDGAYPPTGKDHATLLREKGFFEANVPDPLVVRAVREGEMEFPMTANYDEERTRAATTHRSNYPWSPR